MFAFPFFYESPTNLLLLLVKHLITWIIIPPSFPQVNYSLIFCKSSVPPPARTYSLRRWSTGCFSGGKTAVSVGLTPDHHPLPKLKINAFILPNPHASLTRKGEFFFTSARRSSLQCYSPHNLLTDQHISPYRWVIALSHSRKHPSTKVLFLTIILTLS
jgi:hypothetical protein